MEHLNLRKIRDNKKQSQQTAANEIGVSYQTYVYWERGLNNPSPENKYKLDKWIKEE